MRCRFLSTVALLTLVTTPAQSQHAIAPRVRPIPEEVKQFAFLIGQFDLDVKPAATNMAQRIHGVRKVVGTWKGWRSLDGFGVDDELRITDEAGNPLSLLHSVRYFDSDAKHWRTTAVEPYRGAFTSATSEWRDNAMIATSTGSDSEGKSYVARSRYYDITPTGFKFRQDRSMDEGKTWTEGLLSITATRVAPPVAHE